jgi:hypothetical protein
MAQSPQTQQSNKGDNCAICGRTKHATGEHNPLCAHIADLYQLVKELKGAAQEPKDKSAEKKSEEQRAAHPTEHVDTDSDQSRTGPGLEE